MVIVSETGACTATLALRLDVALHEQVGPDERRVERAASAAIGAVWTPALVAVTTGLRRCRVVMFASWVSAAGSVGHGVSGSLAGTN